MLFTVQCPLLPEINISIFFPIENNISMEKPVLSFTNAVVTNNLFYFQV